MRPAVSAVKQLLRVVVQHHGGRVSESKGSVVPIERIESRILLVRGHKVLLDADLAAKELDTWRSQVVMSRGS